MKVATYTDEQIIEAGMQLLADNKRVTPFGIRKLIGGGNPERIKNIWQASQKEALEGQIVTEHVELPTEFADSLDLTKSSLDELAQRMYGRAQEIAESRVRETISAARKAKETAEAEIAEAMEAVAELDHDKESLHSQVDELRTQLQQQTSENARLQERVGVLTKKTEKSQHELNKEKGVRKQLEKEVTTLQVKNEIAKEQINNLSKQADTLEIKLQEANTKAQKQQLKNTQLQFNIKQENNNKQKLQEQLSLQKDKLKSTQSEFVKEKNNHQKSTNQLALSESKLKETSNRLDSTTNKLELAKNEEVKTKELNAELRGKLAILEEQSQYRKQQIKADK